MAGKSIAPRLATWRVLYVDSSGARRVSTVTSKADADALSTDLADQGIDARVKSTKAAWRARFVDDSGREHAKHFARKRDAQTWLDTHGLGAIIAAVLGIISTLAIILVVGGYLIVTR